MNRRRKQFFRALAGLLASFAVIACASAEEVEIAELRKEIKELRITVRSLEKHNESLHEAIQQLDKHFDTGAKIPKAPAKPEREIEKAIIRIDLKGNSEFDGKPAQADAIRRKIETIIGEDKIPQVELHVDARCPYKSVLDVMNMLAALEIRNVTFKELSDQESEVP